MIALQIGDVIELPVGLRVRNNQANTITTVEAATLVVIESVWPILAGVGGTNHFEDGILCAARALSSDGSYSHDGILYTFAQAGDFRTDFILPDVSHAVLRKMIRVFLP